MDSGPLQPGSLHENQDGWHRQASLPLDSLPSLNESASLTSTDAPLIELVDVSAAKATHLPPSNSCTPLHRRAGAAGNSKGIKPAIFAADGESTGQQIRPRMTAFSTIRARTGSTIDLNCADGSTSEYVPGAGPMHSPPEKPPLLDNDYKLLLSQKQHSLNCLPPRNVLHDMAELVETPADRRVRVCCTWFLAPVIGICVALVSSLIVFATRSSNDVKFGILRDKLADNNYLVGWAAYAGWNASFLFLSAVILNYIQPAGGSGIAEVKAYLNGASVPNAFTFSTFLTKIVVTFLCVSASMPIGSQGPMTHTGALVGGWLAHHSRAAARRLCCCVGRAQDPVLEEDRPEFPSHHPLPSAVEAIEEAAASGVLLPQQGGEMLSSGVPDSSTSVEAGTSKALHRSQQQQQQGMSVPPVIILDSVTPTGVGASERGVESDDDSTSASPSPAPSPSPRSAEVKERFVVGLASRSAIRPTRQMRSRSHGLGFGYGTGKRHGRRLSLSSLLDIGAMNDAVQEKALADDGFNEIVDDTKGQRWGQSVPHVVVRQDSTVSLGKYADVPAPLLPAVLAGAAVSQPLEPEPGRRDSFSRLGAPAVVASAGGLPPLETPLVAEENTSSKAAGIAVDASSSADRAVVDDHDSSSDGEGGDAKDSGGDMLGALRSHVNARAGEGRFAHSHAGLRGPTESHPATSSGNYPPLLDRPSSYLPFYPAPPVSMGATESGTTAGNSDSEEFVNDPFVVGHIGDDGKVPPIAPVSGCGPRWLRRITPPAFDTDQGRRDFVCVGAASGIASAVTAPLAGTLFASYELYAHWNSHLGLLTLVGAVFASITSAFCLTGLGGEWGSFVPRLYAVFYVGSGMTSFEYFDLITFVILGALGGGLGMLFARALDAGARLRSRLWGKRKPMMVLDTVAVAIIWSTVCLFLPLVWPCQPISPEFAILESQKIAPPGTFVPLRYGCPMGEHNPLADLMLVRQDMMLKHLLVREMDTWYSLGQLAVFFFAYFTAVVAVGSTSVISGLIVPNLTLGAALGRFFGLALSQIFDSPGADPHFNPGAFAAVGAAAFVVGCTANAFTYAVMMLDVMGDLSFFVPIVLASAVSYLVSSALGESVYTLALIRKGLPVLDFTPPHELKLMKARHIMIRDPVCLGVGEPVGHVLAVLGSCTHNGFPVVFSACARSRRTVPTVAAHRSGHQAIGCNAAVVGMITRKQITALLARRVWRLSSREFTPAEFNDAARGRMLTLAEVTEGLSERDLQSQLDLGPYVDRTPMTVHTHYAADMVFSLFTSFSMRHLPVVDERGALAGIITRLELLTRVIQHKYAALALREARDVRFGLPSLIQRECARSTAAGLRRVYYLGDSAAAIGEAPFAEAKLKRANEDGARGAVAVESVEASSVSGYPTTRRPLNMAERGAAGEEIGPTRLTKMKKHSTTSKGADTGSPEASPSTASGAFAAAVVGVKFNATNASEDAVDVAAVAVAPASVESSVAATYGGLAAPGDREGNEGGDVSHSE